MRCTSRSASRLYASGVQPANSTDSVTAAAAENLTCVGRTGCRSLALNARPFHLPPAALTVLPHEREAVGFAGPIPAPPQRNPPGDRRSVRPAGPDPRA